MSGAISTTSTPTATAAASAADRGSTPRTRFASLPMAKAK